LVVVLAGARLTRLVTTDWIFEWLVTEKLRRWALNRESWLPNEWYEGKGLTLHERIEVRDEAGVGSWRLKLVSGLDCGFCVGFWVSLGMVIGLRVPLPSSLRWTRDRLLEALALNYVSAHLSSRLD
jgi:hypothetical protein